MFRSMRCCLNPKVIGGLLAAGLVMWVMAPAGGVVGLPLLIALVCPLSMGVMMWRMRGSGESRAATTTGSAASTASSDIDQQLRQAQEDLAIERARHRLADEGKQSPA